MFLGVVGKKEHIIQVHTRRVSDLVKEKRKFMQNKVDSAPL